mmetsp:Transcript_10537/g.11832  ORF Transcript_10537/g.11832 Transcript_10537/m.11832 type:complete len:108 (-) Transcript_10537:3-326(-)
MITPRQFRDKYPQLFAPLIGKPAPTGQGLDGQNGGPIEVLETITKKYTHRALSELFRSREIRRLFLHFVATEGATFISKQKPSRQSSLKALLADFEHNFLTLHATDC